MTRARALFWALLQMPAPPCLRIFFLWRTHQVVVSRSATYTYTLHLALIPPSPIPGVSITVGGTLSLCGVFP